MPFPQFFSGHSFNFEFLRLLGHVPSGGADIGEILSLAPIIKSGDFESFYAAWSGLAEKTAEWASRSDITTASGKVSVRNALFKAASYYRAADLYLHGDLNEQRINNLWTKQMQDFDGALQLLPSPGRRITIETPHGFNVSAIYFCAQNIVPAPTLIIGNGWDGNQEESTHVIGFGALERGVNVLTYEGPGQPTVRREQSLGFIHDWEKVVTPVVDYIEKHASEMCVDMDKLGL